MPRWRYDAYSGVMEYYRPTGAGQYQVVPGFLRPQAAIEAVQSPVYVMAGMGLDYMDILLAPIGAGDRQAVLNKVNALQNGITIMVARVAGIGKETWEGEPGTAVKGRIQDAIAAGRPLGFGWEPFDSQQSDLRRAIDLALVKGDNIPSPEAQTEATQFLTAARKLTDLYFDLLPDYDPDALARAQASEADTTRRISNLPPLQDPKTVGYDVFKKDLQTRAENLAGHVSDLVMLPFSIPTWAYIAGGVAVLAIGVPLLLRK